MPCCAGSVCRGQPGHAYTWLCLGKMGVAGKGVQAMERAGHRRPGQLTQRVRTQQPAFSTQPPLTTPILGGHLISWEVAGGPRLPCLLLSWAAGPWRRTLSGICLACGGINGVQGH